MKNMTNTGSNFKKKPLRPWQIDATKNGKKTTFYLQEVLFDDNEPGFICYGARGVRKKDYAFYGVSVALATKAIEANYGVKVHGWK